ncbi:MBL fold metallo-hydrolase [Aceticella autotrophica]|uniref:MBL fold metallo-hydrolase n=1 Tax=Aceticella autotrophica TaxID=2755338 RepID=A0A975AV33_9THEO|nr:MBL fold metallo-hydrolase [Aceticella autotrophica]QSZ26984.1 MBL fold metallo-hydrolase [Aceticella autotrophica]
MEIQVLIENLIYKKGFIAEHGLSLLVKKDDAEVLIDTGQTDNFMKNSGLMGIDLKKIKKVVLTHGHYDHVGGLKKLIEENRNVHIYANNEILSKKYIERKSGDIEEIGFDISLYEKNKENFILISEDKEIEKDFYVVTNTNIEYNNDFTTKHFLIEKNNKKLMDKFEDEVFVVVKEGNVINIITGCSHAGILNILHTAKKRFEGFKIKSLIGGFHLKGMPSSEVEDIAWNLKEYNMEKIYTGHCTGVEEYAILKNILRDRISYLTTSSSIII